MIVFLGILYITSILTAVKEGSTAKYFSLSFLFK